MKISLRKIFKITIIGAIALFFLAIIGFTALFLKIYKYSFIDEAQKADVVAVLGASQWNGKPSPILQSRLDHALFLYEKRFSDKFILTGGIGDGETISESQAGKNYLAQQGISGNDIFTEETGRTTWQSMNEILKIAKERDFNSIILVSSGYHVFRIKKMADDLGLKSFVSPVEEKFSFQEMKYVFREAVVYIIYRFAKI